MSILTSHMMVTKNPQNVHRNYFWAILLTFIFDIKIDINICEPHYVNLFFLWTSSIVCMFDFLIFDIFLTTSHLFDILTHQLNLNPPQPAQGYFCIVNTFLPLDKWSFKIQCIFEMQFTNLVLVLNRNDVIQAADISKETQWNNVMIFLFPHSKKNYLSRYICH